MISIFVTIKIKAGFIEQFRDASFGDSEGSVRDEPGCFRFDILQNSENPQVFHLYEVYEDDAAFEVHKNTPHYKIWRSKVEPWFDGEVEGVKMQTIFPSDNGWREQKACLLNW